ncbi:MAG: hypothetical protein ACLFPI_00565 [Desulfobacterales bacterium]
MQKNTSMQLIRGAERFASDLKKTVLYIKAHPEEKAKTNPKIELQNDQNKKYKQASGKAFGYADYAAGPSACGRVDFWRPASFGLF